MTVGMLCARANGIWNITRMNHEPMYTGFRPKYSDNGARSMGPIANPRRYIDKPTVPSSVEELNAVTISGAAEE